jgi:tetraacyldisaccharide 4'-kinase
MRAWLERVWYGDARGGFLLRPLALLFALAGALRRWLYRSGRLRSLPSGRPVVVVGNLSVGGSGKTPLVAWLADALAAAGLRVGIVSRGYGGAGAGPLRVLATTDPRLAGDEPVLLARRTAARVAIGRDRVAAARLVSADVDLILADDGLQHYRLARDLEILVLDGARRYGNGRLLPAGPLREPVARGRRAAFTVVNGGPVAGEEVAMTLVPVAVVELASGARAPLASFAGRAVHALAGIGNPARFFATLRAAGLTVHEHPLPDHAALTPEDVRFDDGLPVLMTEKDAVKCGSFPPAGLYWLDVAAELPAVDAARILKRLLALAQGA